MVAERNNSVSASPSLFPAKLVVAIPTYNRQPYLKDSLDSIFKQTFQDFKVVVFDNHSDYDIQTFLKRWPADRISLIRNETNVGYLGNMNRVFSHKFDTELVIVFHDDNTMHPELLKRAVDVLDSNPEVRWVGTGLNFAHDDNLMFQFDELPEKSKALILSQPELIRLILRDFHLSFDTAMYRTNALIDLSSYTKNFGKWYDRPYMIALAKNGQAAVLPERMENLRQHPGQASNIQSEDALTSLLNFWQFYKENLPQPLSPEDTKLFTRWSSNNTPLTAANFSSGFKEYKEILAKFRSKGFFRLKYVNIRGLWFFLKALRKLGFK